MIVCSDRMLTAKEVAEIVRRHPDTVRKWIREGRLKVSVLPGQRTLIDQQELLRFLTPVVRTR